MNDKQIKKARTFMPEILFPGTGLSPLTDKSVIPTNNVTTIQDIMEGKTTYKIPGGGGSWSSGDDAQSSYKEEGDAYKRQERYLDILRRMSLPQNTSIGEEWTVKTEGGSKTFNSLQMAQDYKRKLNDAGFKVKWISRTKTAQAQFNKIDVVNMALQKTFKVIVRKANSNLESNGAAFCIAKNLFLTCAHVIQKYNKNTAEKINLYEVDQNSTIYLVNGPKKYIAKVLSVDEINDIALLESNININPFGLQTEINVGDEIIAVGSPHGFENNASFGHVTSLNKKIYTHKGAPSYIFIDANVFAGNSGGPIINQNTGMVIGMVTAIASATGEYGLNSGLPATYLQSFCVRNKISLI